MSFKDQVAAGLARLAQGLLTLKSQVPTSSAHLTHGTGTVSDAISSALLSVRNRVRNGSFRRNVRQVSGTVVLGPYGYGHDCWRASAGGCTYSYATTGGVTTITITAGELVQVVDGASQQGGAHTLSWEGTAPGKLGNGAWAASPITADLTAWANVGVSFGVGTVRLVQLEPGSQASAFEWLPPALDDLLTDRYVRVDTAMLGGGLNTVLMSYFGGSSAILYMHIPRMRALPNSQPINTTGIEFYSFTGVWTASAASGGAYGTADSPMLALNLTCDGDGRSKLFRKSGLPLVFLSSAEL